MSERLSAMMDAEVSDEEAASLVEALSDDDALAERWGTYHLIGDALRGTPPAAIDRKALAERLGREPAIVAAPLRKRRPALVARNTVSMAAGIAAVAFVGWVAMPIFQSAPSPAALVADVQPAKPAPAAVIPAAHGVEDYLLAHQRFSPTFAMQGAVPYVRMVSEEAKEPRR